MKKLLFSLCMIALFQVALKAQHTPEIEKELNAKVEKLAIDFKKKLIKEQTSGSDFWTTFKVDTFRIERYVDLRMEKDYSTQGMNFAMREGETRYDKLLNNYYKMLLQKMKAEDKKLLVEAQKAWLDFRDKEIKLTSKLLSPEYTGGGTMYSNIVTGKIYQLTKDRVLELAQHLDNN